MNIKEVALKVADSLRNKIDGISHMQSNQGLVRFAEVLISAYKAELLKEVGEPVAFMCSDEELCHKGYERFSRHNSGEWNIPIFTSDQVAAAIIKATKPLEERRCEICGYAEHHREHTSCLRTQLAAAREENGRLEDQVLARDAELWGRAQEILGLKDQLAKAEQRVAEWQPISTAPKDGTAILGCGGLYNDPKNGWFNTVCWWSGYAFVDDGGYVDFVTHWMPLPKAPANGASS